MAENDRLTGLVGNSGMKVPVRVATTAAITLSGLQTIDGVTVVANDRVLVKDQSSSVNNGIYVADTGTWERAKDADGPYDFVNGTLVPVAAGSTYGGYVFKTAGTDPIDPGTDAMTFSQALFSGLTGVTFLQAGTGAVSRAAQDKMREIVSVKDFGATGDGSTDDTAAIQAAIDVAVAGGGGIVLFPPGFYKTTSALTITKGVVLQGSGIGLGTGTGNSGGTVIRSGAAAGDVITISSAQSCTLLDFTIDCPSFTKASGTAGVRVQGEGGSGNTNNRTRLQNVRISNMYDAIVWDAASNLVMHGCHVQDFLNIGVYSKQTGATDSGHNTIDSCVIWDLNVGTSQASVRYDKGGDIRIVNNKMLGSTYGVRVVLDDGETGTMLVTGNSFEEQLTNNIRIAQGTTGKNFGNLVVVGNQFSFVAPSSPQSNIAIVAGTAGGGAPTWIKNISIVGNVFNNAHNIATATISVQDGTGVTVAANALNANSSSNPIGIDVGGSVVSAKVTGNSVVNYTAGNEYATSTTAFKTPTAILNFSTGAGTVANNLTRYLGLADAVSSEGDALFYIPYKCLALNLMTTAGAAPGGSDTFTYTLRVNGSDTTLTSQASASTSDSQDRTHVVAIPSPAGPSTAARVSMKLVTSATAATTNHRVSVQITENT